MTLPKQWPPLSKLERKMLAELVTANNSTQRLLFVDTDAIVRRYASKSLGQSFETHTAASALEALHTLKDQSIDIMVVAEQLPDMGGLSLLQIVQAHLPHVQCILLCDDEPPSEDTRCIHEPWPMTIMREDGVSGVYELLLQNDKNS